MFDKVFDKGFVPLKDLVFQQTIGCFPWSLSNGSLFVLIKTYRIQSIMGSIYRIISCTNTYPEADGTFAKVIIRTKPDFREAVLLLALESKPAPELWSSGV